MGGYTIFNISHNIVPNIEYTGSHDPQTLLSMPRLQEVVTEHAQSSLPNSCISCSFTINTLLRVHPSIG